MYEDITYELLLARMLEKAHAANANLDTREGSLVWLSHAPAAVELQNLYLQLDNILRETFADTASREYLMLRAAERGIVPYSATPATLRLQITPPTLELDANTRFSIGACNYGVTDNLGNGAYELTCETAGEIGNAWSGPVLPIDYVEGLESCTITGLLVPGEDEEDTEAFRKRYFDSLNAQAFGGNRADYLEKVNAIPGVGGVKVYRAWNGDIKPAVLLPPEGTAEWIAGASAPEGVKAWLETIHAAAAERQLTVGGTVRVVVIDSTFAAPSQALVELVQTTVDPLQNAGEGEGIAPIGHVVKVEGVQETVVDLSFSLSYQKGLDWETVKPYVLSALNAYFKELAKTWAEQGEELIVRISQVESRVLGVTGIQDISGTKINGLEANFSLASDRIPVLGELTARG